MNNQRTFRVIFAFLVGIGMVVGAKAAGPDPGLNVIVNNPPTKPVPVTGTLGVGGTVDVDGTVTVINPDNAAVPIRDAGQPQPVDGQCTLIGGGGRTSFCDIFVVPAGKRLVVELISYRASGSSTDGDPVNIIFGDREVMNCGNCASRYFLPAVFAGLNGGRRDFSDMRQTRVYLDQNKTLGGRIEWGANNSLGGEITFSGFLVNR